MLPFSYFLFSTTFQWEGLEKLKHVEFGLYPLLRIPKQSNQTISQKGTLLTKQQTIKPIVCSICCPWHSCFRNTLVGSIHFWARCGATSICDGILCRIWVFCKTVKICTLKSTSSVYLPACSIIPIYSSLDYDAGSWANISQSHDPNSGQPRNFWHTSHIFLPHITFRSHTEKVAEVAFRFSKSYFKDIKLQQIPIPVH